MKQKKDDRKAEQTKLGQETSKISNQKSRRNDKIKNRLCMLLGGLLMGAALLQLAGSYYSENRLLASLEALAEERQEETESLTGVQSFVSPLSAIQNQQEAAWQQSKQQQEEQTQEIEAENMQKAGALLGSLTIAAIDLEAPIREGAERASLRDALGHLTGTAPLGAAYGNCAIAGHRNYTFGRFFNRLDEVEVGDEVIVTDAAGNSYKYVVQEIEVVEPEEVSVVEPTGGGELTLITCTPIYIASHRLILHCRMVEN